MLCATECFRLVIETIDAREAITSISFSISDSVVLVLFPISIIELGDNNTITRRFSDLISDPTESITVVNNRNRNFDV